MMETSFLKLVIMEFAGWKHRTKSENSLSE